MDPFCYLFHACHAFLSVHCSLFVVTCWARANLLPLLYVMFLVFLSLLSLSHVVSWFRWALIVSILDLCLFTYFAFDGGQKVLWLISVALLVDGNHIGRLPLIRYDSLV